MEIAFLHDWRLWVFAVGVVGNLAVTNWVLWLLWSRHEERRKHDLTMEPVRDQRIQTLATLQANFKTAQQDIVRLEQKVKSTHGKVVEETRMLYSRIDLEVERSIKRHDDTNGRINDIIRGKN